jgi:hypothetical protein
MRFTMFSTSYELGGASWVDGDLLTYESEERGFVVRVTPTVFKTLLALLVGVAPAWIAGVQKPWMALDFHSLVIRISAISAAPLTGYSRQMLRSSGRYHVNNPVAG